MNSLPSPTRISRRLFLGASASVTALALPAAHAIAAAKGAAGGRDLTDVNVSLSRWPLRRLPCDDTPSLVAKLRRHGVTQAWAGSFDALLHKDLRAVNDHLALECRQHGHGLLLPFGSINPKAPDWEDELRRCAEVHQMPGLRLHPNYHGYKLDDPSFARLLRLAANRHLIVQLVLAMEDERTMHPLLRVEPVDPAPLAESVRQIPGLRLVLLNALRALRGDLLRNLLAVGNVAVELATLEGVGGVANLLKQIPLPRLLFGSHAPFFYFESALLKVQESPLTQDQLNAIRRENAQRLRAATR
ncbi:MAG: amidohydrolase family protein [Verrucomicrobia bacterium]|nr:amidohydrolase family protein [Verrucomicrobiota bacterium]